MPKVISDNAQPTVHLGYLPDDTVIAHIRRAKERICFVGPGLSIDVARAISEWWRLHPAAVEVIVDADSDLCRLGLGDGDALTLLFETAQEIEAVVLRQSGVRLCVLDVDGERLIFPPAPRLVEAPRQDSAQVILAPVQGESLVDTILSPPELAAQPLTRSTVEKVGLELKVSPPQPFDLARQVRVLSTRFQFVEFSLQNAALSRKRVPVPPDLLGIGVDPDTEELLRASFQLIGKGDEISGENLMKHRDEIEKKYLVTIAHYGKIILQTNRATFGKEVETLRAKVTTFQTDAVTKLNSAIEKNCSAVIARLLPLVKVNLPERWKASLGPKPPDQLIARRLEEDLKAAYGEASHYLGRIEVRLIYKDITVEMLRDQDFARAAAKAKLFLEEMYEEYQAARARA